MAGIMNKIGETLHMGGGQKEGEKRHDENQYKSDHGEKYGHKEGEKHHDEHQYKSDHGEKPGHKEEGLMGKVKDKIHGGSGEHNDKGDKKKKEKKKKHEHGHEHHGDSSSDSD